MAAMLCTICPRADRAEIDAAIRGKVSARKIAAMFAIGRTAISNHKSRCVTGMGRAAKPKSSGGRPTRPVVPRVALIELETPADVLRELQWAYGETRALYETAKATSDTRLMDKALAGGAAILDRFAKSFNMFSDATVVNLDASTKHVTMAISSMTTDEIKATLEAIRSGVTTTVVLPSEVIDAEALPT